MKITVYSTATCGYCYALKRWLSDNQIDYTEYQVDRNPIAANYMVSLSGQMGVPFTTIEQDDGQVDKVLGFDKAKLTSILIN